MSFRVLVRGMDREQALTADEFPQLVHYPPEEAYDGEAEGYMCESIVPGTNPPELAPIVPCRRNGTATHSYGVPVASVAALRPADYYAVVVAYVGQNGYGSGWQGCGSYAGGPSDGGAETCWPEDPAWFYTTISGQYVSLQDGSAVASEGQTPMWEGTTMETNQAFVLGEYGFDFHDPRHGQIVYLVNGSPPLPVPDEFGNEFTKCLFTLGQLPGEITSIVTTYNAGLRVNGAAGLMQIGIIPYNLWGQEPDGEGQILYVGEA